MSDIDTAVDGEQEAAPVVEQAPVQTTVTEPNDSADPPRNEKGEFVPRARVNEITREKWEERRGREAAEARATDLERQLSEYRRPTQEQEIQTNGPPTLESCEFDIDRLNAETVKYAEIRARELIRSEFQNREFQSTHKQLEDSFGAKSEVYAKANPTYVDDLRALDDVVTIPSQIVELVYSLDNSPEVAHHLATHYDLADRLSRMTPVAAALELGRLSSQLAVQKTIPVSQTPAPTPKIGGGSSIGLDLMSDKTSIDDFMAARNKR
jgi:hypothetical protein